MITAAIQRSSQLFAAVKLEKHNNYNNLGFSVQIKSDNVIDAMSQAIQDEGISSIAFNKIM